jgi:hypothetical protein
MRFGEFHLELVEEPPEQVDGSVIFGVVPEALWRRRFPPDAQGQVRLARRALLVRGAGITALVAGGPGQYGLDRHTREGVDAFVLSHPLDRRIRDQFLSDFPNATLDGPAAGRPDLEREIRPGLTAFALPGPDGDALGLRIDSGGRTAAYLADALPTAAHVPTAWLVAAERYPVELIRGKKKLVDRAAREGWLCVFWRDPDVPWGVIVDEPSGRRRVHVVPRSGADL